MLHNLYRFSAYNSQAAYGWGDETEAAKYCNFLNRNREINTYSFEEVTDADECGRYIASIESSEAVNLDDALAEIEGIR